MLALLRKIWTTPVVTEPLVPTDDNGQIEVDRFGRLKE